MGVRELLVDRLGQDAEEPPYTCLNCGAGLDLVYHTCPNCGSFAIDRRWATN